MFCRRQNLDAGRIHSARADQSPGVPAGLQSRGAAYKNNMYALLGKPGYEELKAKLEARL